jgi:hypothetical protein
MSACLPATAILNRTFPFCHAHISVNLSEKGSNLNSRLELELAARIGDLNISLATIKRPTCTGVANAILEVGHDDPNLRLDSEHSMFNRKTMRNTLKERAGTIKNQYIVQSKSVSSITIVINTRTIERSHFLDIVLLAPAFRIRPFLYDSV